MKAVFYFIPPHDDYAQGVIFYGVWKDGAETEVCPSACVFMIP